MYTNAEHRLKIYYHVLHNYWGACPGEGGVGREIRAHQQPPMYSAKVLTTWIFTTNYCSIDAFYKFLEFNEIEEFNKVNDFNSENLEWSWCKVWNQE